MNRVLIANRGEIAVRIARTLRTLGIESVVAHSRRDAASLAVELADAAVCLPDSDGTGGYLDVSAVVDAAVAAGCSAIHPGYGFLSENPLLPRACADAGIVFIGPSGDSMEALGDKERARQVATRAGVAVVPGAASLADAQALPMPVLIKPVAGGGGKGMHVAWQADELPELAMKAEREATSSFGDGRLIFERYLPRARHIEVQIAALPDGRVLALGDRECTLQRRHQKVIEEAPAPGLPAGVRERLHEAAVAVIREVGYLNLATVEFVMSADDPTEFYFLEVNTRLQVEHPVTEQVTGLDLVELQLHIAAMAAGAALSTNVDADVPTAAATLVAGGSVPATTGHSVEVRIYAEDAHRRFLPTGGRMRMWHVPDSEHIRLDAGVRVGDVIGSGYDPMIAKLIATGDNRTQALHRLDSALAQTAILGTITNTGFLKALLALPEVRDARMDTRLIDRIFSSTDDAPTLPEAAIAAWALTARGNSDDATSAWSSNWRVSGVQPLTVRGSWGTTPLRIGVERREHGFHLVWSEHAHTVEDVAPSENAISFTLDGQPRRAHWVRARDVDGESTWIGLDGEAWQFLHRMPSRESVGTGTASPTVRSPMPGTVLQVLAQQGEIVAAGQPLVVLEAMKMEHQVLAPMAGELTHVNCVAGSHVRLGEVLAVVEPTA